MKQILLRSEQELKKYVSIEKFKNTIEVIFSLDGLGLLGFESVMNRDYPVIFGTLYMFALLGLVLNLSSDLTYRLIDPRIDFERRKA